MKEGSRSWKEKGAYNVRICVHLNVKMREGVWRYCRVVRLTLKKGGELLQRRLTVKSGWIPAVRYK